MARSRHEPLVLIELVRFACAAAVMTGHYLIAFWAAPDARQHALLATAAVGAPHVTANYGWLGVELFFVISGMMIARSAGGGPARTFIRRRAMRLLPTAWVCATITLAVLVLGGAADIGTLLAWLRSVTFMPVGEQVDGVYWTLGIEVCFYALVAASLGDGDPRRLARLGGALAMVSAAYWSICLMMGPTIDPVNLNRTAQLLLLPHGCFFALGIAIARWQSGVRSGALMATTVIAAGTAIAEVAWHAAASERETGIALSHPIALALFIGGVVLLAMATRAQPLLRRLPGQTVATLGLMTYPLYLLHQDVGAILIAALAHAGLSVGLAIGATAALMLAMAVAVVRSVEPPVARCLGMVIDRCRQDAGSGNIATV